MSLRAKLLNSTKKTIRPSSGDYRVEVMLILVCASKMDHKIDMVYISLLKTS